MAAGETSLFRTVSLGAALLLLAISLATGFAIHDWKRRHAEAFAHPYDSTQWMVFQGAYEAFKLQRALDLADGDSDPQEAELRHEIFQSRMLTLASSAVGRLLRNDETGSRHLETLAALALRLDALMRDEHDRPGQRRAEIEEVLAAVLLACNDLAMRVVQISAELRTADLLDLRASQRVVVDLFSIGAACTVGLFVIVTAQLRRLRRERERAEQASAAKSAFLATMSHELRTPLNGVIGTLELLAEDAMPPESRTRVMLARRSADQLLAIIGDVLDMAKLESGLVVLENVPFQIDRTLESVVSTFASVAQRRGLTLTLTLDDSARGWFEGDPTRLRQIASNLVSNALKFTETGGVTVSLAGTEQDEGTRLTLRVTDSGVGIHAGALSRLGHHFEQGDTSTTRRYGGTGLGLAITRTLAEAMKGGMSIESTVGKGTTVAVTALLRRAREAENQEPARTPARPGLTVLVAEDNPVNQTTVRTMLERLGASVDIAEDGIRAVQAATRKRYDLILMDMQLPRLDGLEATREIRAGSGPSARTRIVALTANAFIDDGARCLAAGMDAHLTKPVRKSTLASLLASVSAGEEPRHAA